MHVQADDIHLTVGQRSILSGVTFDARSGSTVAITGTSGSGKTTLLNCIGLLLPTTSGRVLLDGRDVTRISSRSKSRLWCSKITFVFQDYGLVDDETVGQNVALGMSGLFRSRAKWPTEVENALTVVGLGGRARDYVTKLSGGERQRVGIARAIYKRAPLILADEPTASLDRANREHIQSLLLGAADRGATVIVATHDEALAGACDLTIPL